MRIVKNYQIAIEDIQIDASSRDDIPAVLKGIQHVYRDLAVRERLFALLEEHLRQPAGSATDAADATVGKLNPALGCPGMELWSILVLALLKQGINCDFDRLAELANKRLDVRRMLGLSDTFCDWHFSYCTLVRNVGLLTPDLLAAVNRLVVEAGLPRVRGRGLAAERASGGGGAPAVPAGARGAAGARGGGIGDQQLGAARLGAGASAGRGRLRAHGGAGGAGGKPAPHRTGAASGGAGAAQAGAREAEAGSITAGRVAAQARERRATDLAGARPASGAPARRKRP